MILTPSDICLMPYCVYVLLNSGLADRGDSKRAFTDHLVLIMAEHEKGLDRMKSCVSANIQKLSSSGIFFVYRKFVKRDHIFQGGSRTYSMTHPKSQLSILNFADTICSSFFIEHSQGW